MQSSGGIEYYQVVAKARQHSSFLDFRCEWFCCSVGHASWPVLGFMGRFEKLNQTEALSSLSQKICVAKKRTDQCTWNQLCQWCGNAASRKEGSTAQRREVKKFPNGFKSGTHEIDVDGKDQFPINRDSELTPTWDVKRQLVCVVGVGVVICGFISSCFRLQFSPFVSSIVPLMSPFYTNARYARNRRNISKTSC